MYLLYSMQLPEEQQEPMLHNNYESKQLMAITLGDETPPLSSETPAVRRSLWGQQLLLLLTAMAQRY